MKYTHFKTKAFFTLGIYLLFWRYSLMCGLRDDFNVDIAPGREMWLGCIPIYGAYRWWLVLKHLEGLQQRAGLGVVLSPARAFFISSFWFGSGPYLNRHINALYFFKQGHKLGVETTTAGAPALIPVPEVLPRAV